MRMICTRYNIISICSGKLEEITFLQLKRRRVFPAKKEKWFELFKAKMEK